MERTEPYDAERLIKQANMVLNVIDSPDTKAHPRSLPFKQPIVIGRQTGDGVNVVIDDKKLSRRHLTFKAAKNGIAVEDHDSLNGTFVNGTRIAGERELKPGDIVRAGRTLFELGNALANASDTAFIGRSHAVSELLASVDKAAKVNAPILIVAETGTGKELIAERIHRVSGKKGALVPVNCAALPESLAESSLFGHTKGSFTSAAADQVGFFERSDGGTLFLDEIGTLPDVLQPKLLRAIESSEVTRVGASLPKKIELRVVAATNVDLRAAADSGKFRSDLYARISAFVVTIPPLRARRGDIPMLARHFLALAGGKHLDMSIEYLEALVLYAWPRNVRELKAFMQRAVVAEGPTLGTADIPAEILTPIPLTEAEAADADDAEVPSEEELLKVLEASKGNVSRVADHYGRSRQQVYRWLKRYNLSVERFRPPE